MRIPYSHFHIKPRRNLGAKVDSASTESRAFVKDYTFFLSLSKVINYKFDCELKRSLRVLEIRIDGAACFGRTGECERIRYLPSLALLLMVFW